MKYYKYEQEETRGDEYDHWGFFTWYTEVDNSGYAHRQIEVYRNGPKLKYSKNFPGDIYGGLSDQKIGIIENETIECPKEEFEYIWNKD